MGSHVQRLISGILAIWLGLAAVAMAEPRIALVIGNGAYRSVNGLPNPPNDAKLMADALKRVGFQVTLVADGDMATMGSAVSAFGSALRQAGPDATGLFYYAGHGVQSFGRNYLVPVDAKLSNAADLSLVAIDAQSVLVQMASARNRTNIVILDACRNNPFRNVRDLGDNGLAEMSAPTGTILAYATAPGQVALDGADGNSPFTKALAARIATPGLAIEQVFKDVRVSVLALSGGKQTPWDTSSLTGDFSFVADGSAGDEAGLWANVSVAKDPVQVMLFLRAYPKSAHEVEARALLAALMQTEVQGGASKQANAAQSTTTRAPAAVDPAEAAAFAVAQKTGTLAAFQGFLATYPASTFTEAVTAEIAALNSKVAAAPVVAAAVVAAPAGGVVDAETAALIAGQDIRFAKPLTVGSPNIVGLSIEQLIQGSPMYSPIDGLPKELWQGKTCSTCHKWTQAALCDQGKFYAKEVDQVALLPQHPKGGAFKLVLKAWATQGCK